MASQHSNPQGHVLLLGGPSGSGKSTAAKDLAQRLGIGWVQVDDLRLALQWSEVRLPSEEATNALRFFEQTPNVWSLPSEQLFGQLLAVGNALADAIAIVAANHVAQGDSAIIEGDAILPALLHHPLLESHLASGKLAMVFVLPDSEVEILQVMIERGRDPEAKVEPASRMNWLFTQRLRDQATDSGIAILDSRPRSMLNQRLEHIWRDLSGKGLREDLG